MESNPITPSPLIIGARNAGTTLPHYRPDLRPDVFMSRFKRLDISASGRSGCAGFAAELE